MSREGETMDKFFRHLCSYIYDRLIPVVASIILSMILGTHIARRGTFNAHQLGILSSSVWLCAGVYLRFVSPRRENISRGLPAVFWFTSLCILGSTGMYFLPEKLGRDVQASAYIGFAFVALLSLTIIVFVAHEEGDALRRLRF